jgi:hypothetical protein
MKIQPLIVVLSAALFAILSAQAQGTFQNLDFEGATPGPPITGPIGGADYQPVGLALPGWSASIDGTPVTEVLQNDYTLGAASIDIFGPGWNSVNPGVIGGDYTVLLQTFFASEGDVSLWQNGTIPASAQSLQFSAWNLSGNGAFTVSFAGHNLSPVVLSSGQTASGQFYDVYGVNIAQYAGQAGQLEFTALDNNPPGQIELDDIAFSTQVVPEPSPLALTGVGALAFALYRRFSPKRQ